MVPGLTLSKLYSNSMLVLLNNRFIMKGQDGVHHLVVADNHRAHRETVMSHSIAFAHSGTVQTTTSDGNIHTVEGASQSNDVLEGVQDSKARGDIAREV